jgi:hypothetical protein
MPHMEPSSLVQHQHVWARSPFHSKFHCHLSSVEAFAWWIIYFIILMKPVGMTPNIASQPACNTCDILRLHLKKCWYQPNLCTHIYIIIRIFIWIDLKLIYVVWISYCVSITCTDLDHYIAQIFEYPRIEWYNHRTENWVYPLSGETCYLNRIFSWWTRVNSRLLWVLYHIFAGSLIYII